MLSRRVSTLWWHAPFSSSTGPRVSKLYIKRTTHINMYRFFAQVFSSLILGSKVFLVFTSHVHSSRSSDQVGSIVGTLTVAFLTHSR